MTDQIPSRPFPNRRPSQAARREDAFYVQHGTRTARLILWLLGGAGPGGPVGLIHLPWVFPQNGNSAPADAPKTGQNRARRFAP